MSNSSNHSDIKFGIQSNAERYCWAAYFIFGILSSVVGDTLILVASSHKGAFKINKILVTIIKHIAVSDLANTIIILLPVTISVLANSRILGTILCYTMAYISIITYQAGMSLIALLTAAKFLILRYPVMAATWTIKRVHQVCAFIWVSSFTAPILLLVIDRGDVAFDYRVYACMYGFTSNYWTTIKPTTFFLFGILPNIAIVATTVPTLKYIFDARKSAKRVQGSVPWQGALTVVFNSAVYCISSLPYMVYNFVEGFVNENPLGLFHVDYHRISAFLLMINVVANFYIYVFTIKSFRRFLFSKFRQYFPFQSSMPMLRKRLPGVGEGDQGNFLW